MPKLAEPNKPQKQRFLETAREVGATENQKMFDDALKRLGKATVPAKKKAKKLAK